MLVFSFKLTKCDTIKLRGLPKACATNSLLKNNEGWEMNSDTVKMHKDDEEKWIIRSQAPTVFNKTMEKVQRLNGSGSESFNQA
jgi:hypothetical protein